MFLAILVVLVGQCSALFSDIDLNSFTTGAVGSKLIGPSANALLGHRGDTAGDVNRDGFDDMIVGCPDIKVSFVIFGRAESFSLDTASFTSSATNGFKISGAGYGVSGAGDLNGDGYDDVIVGDSTASPYGKQKAGTSFVFFGHAGSFSDISATSFTSSDAVGFRIHGAFADQYLGIAAGAAGDVNGDGFDDVMIGGSGGGTGRGHAYVMFGRRSGFADIDLASLVTTGDNRGFHIQSSMYSAAAQCVGTVGDYNHDGFSDIFFNGPLDDCGYGWDCGTAYIFFGHSNATAFPYVNIDGFTSGGTGFAMVGGQAYDALGSAGQYAGDFNGDGVDDLILGSGHATRSGRTQSGVAYVLFGDRYTTTFSTVDMYHFQSGPSGFQIIGAAAYDSLGSTILNYAYGSSVNYAGDVNGDGLADIMVGSFKADPLGRTDAGTAYVIYGRTSASGPYVTIDLASFTTGALGFKILGAAGGDWLAGSILGYAGDVNGDGTDDMMLSAPNADPSGRSNAGTLYVIYGVGPPTLAPTVLPSIVQTVSPTWNPSIQPTAIPTGPTSQPSAQPSSQPSVNPAALEKILSSRSYQVRNGFAFAALTSSGSVHTWGEAANGGDSSQVQHLLARNVTQIVGSRYSYAAVVSSSNGSAVVPWGVAGHFAGLNAFPSGSYSLSVLISNEAAFAGIDQATGRVIAFGSESHGGNVIDDAKCNGYSGVLSSGVVSIAASAGSFAAIKADGSLYAWGNKHTGADVSSTFLASIVGARLVVATRSAFAVLLKSGRVVAWGDRFGGGDASTVTSQRLHDVVHLTASKSTFAAFKKDSSVVVWGNGPWGGDTSAVAHELTANVTLLAHTFTAMAVLKKDGSVVAWGKADGGGDASAVQSQLVDVVDVCGNSKAFAALTSAGRVVAWGKAAYGGQIPSNKVSALSSGVVSIYHTDRAFAALKSDGSVVVWGQAGHGGSPGAAVEAHLESGVHTICSNDVAFSVIKEDGSVLGWGHAVSVPTAGLLFSAEDFSIKVQCA